MPTCVVSTQRMEATSTCVAQKKINDKLSMRRYAVPSAMTMGSSTKMRMIASGNRAQTAASSAPTATDNCMPMPVMRRMLPASRLPQYCAPRMVTATPTPLVSICKSVWICEPV